MRLSVALTICGVTLGGAFALLWPAVTAARESAAICVICNVFKGIEIYGYEGGCFPPAITFAMEGGPPVSWRTTIAEERKYGGPDYNDHLSWDSPANLPYLRSDNNIYRYLTTHRQSKDDDYAEYFVVTGPGTLFASEEPTPVRSVGDGVSNTVLIIQARDLGTPWTKPEDVPIDRLLAALERDAIEAANLHYPEQWLVFADGGVAAVARPLTPAEFTAILSPNGGEAITRASLVESGALVMKREGRPEWVENLPETEGERSEQRKKAGC